MSGMLENIHCFTPTWMNAAIRVAVNCTISMSHNQRWTKLTDGLRHAPMNVARGGTLM